VKRGYIPYAEKLASLLGPKLGIGYEARKTMSAAEINARFDWHHNIANADGGPDLHWNIEPIEREAHRERTAKIDVPRIAKGKRLRKSWGPWQEAIAMGVKPPKKETRWPRRGLRSRSSKWRKLKV